VDLEWSICDGNWIEIQHCLENIIGTLPVAEDEDARVIYARKLGSKVGTGVVVDRPKKDIYVRAKFASAIPLSALSKQVWDVLFEMISQQVSVNYFNKLKKRAMAENPQLI
jgi:hypothetical protein